MFTGLIAEVGSVGRISRRPGGLEYEIICSRIADRITVGASIAVNGVCQTVTAATGRGFTADAVSSTLEKTGFGKLRTGTAVNLEPALRAGDPLDGHLMQGHVQTTAELISVKMSGVARVLSLRLREPEAYGIISEGSVGIDGISLTVSEVGRDFFSVHIIPETWRNTTLCGKRPGDGLNIEGDLLARSAAGSGSLTESKLLEWGY